MTTTIKITDISFRKVDNGQMRVNHGYQGNGTLIGGKLVIFRTPRGTFADKKMKPYLVRAYLNLIGTLRLTTNSEV